ncbi:MAG: sn-glycerol-3-phosphate ABC transporter ATP-binding protein UgpC [Deltaproteobacteria bacterium]|nr:sn-glycerol-3-phosphate ABC transporter ATP-binding protein UgpC [Deltaproteobacteria bacterium]
MSSLSLRGIRKTLGANAILKGIDLEVPDGSLTVLVGPSGCGKSTLLRTIAGLESPDTGVITLGDRDVTRAEPRDRDIAMVFQSYALYPHLTVRENLAFGLRLRKEPEKLIRARIEEVSAMLGLDTLLDRLPRDMSGGQRQRVAMGRAIARRPKLFLFDEPLSNLDAALRNQVRVEIKKLHATLGATMIYVTHDQVEAMTLADQLVVLSAGTIEQNGPPLTVYAQPVSRFVAEFLGSPSMNFLEATVAKDTRTLRAEGLSLTLDPARFVSLKPDQRVLVGLRPHDVQPALDGPAMLTLAIDVVEAMGFEAFAHGHVAGSHFIARLSSEAHALPKPGDTLGLTLADDRVYLFDPESRRSLARSVP